MDDAWVELSPDEYDKVWGDFFERLKFTPTVNPDGIRSILEPTPSVTYKISEDFGDKNKIADLENKVLSALRVQTPPTGKVYALDWQHDCYWLYPHINFQEWLISVLPDGDYYIFLAEDFRFGIFGHPWEWTSCVWGNELISFFEKSKPELWDKIIRRKL